MIDADRVHKCGNAQWLACIQVHDPARLPALDDPGQRTRTVTKQLLAWSERQRERSVGPEVVRAAVGHQRVVGSPIDGIRETGSKQTNDGVDAQVLAPRICRLPGDTARWPHRHLRVQRVVIVAGVVRDEVNRGELRIGNDEVLREAVESHHRAIDAGRNWRQRGIERGAVVQHI